MLYSYSQFQHIKSKIIEDFQAQPADHFAFTQQQTDGVKDKYVGLCNSLRTSNQRKRDRLEGLKRNKYKSEQRFQESRSKLTEKANHIYITENAFEALEAGMWREESTEEEKELEEIKERSKKVKMKEKNLELEISELENSIRFFRKAINHCEAEFQSIKRSNSKMEHKLKGERTSMSKVQKSSQEIIHVLKATKAQFSKSLRNCKVSVDAEKRKADNLVDELCENLLIFNKKKEKIEAQAKLIKKLEKEEAKLEDDRRMYEELLGKSELLMEAFHVMSDMREAHEPKKAEEISGSKVLKICQKLTNFLKRIKDNEEKLRKKCELKIGEKEELERMLKNVEDNIGRSLVIGKGYSHDEEDKEYEESLLLRKREKVVNKMTTIAIAFEDRVLYFVQRQLLRLKYIISNWAKYDNSACQFLLELESSLEEVAELETEYMQEPEVEKCLQEFFEKWEDYLFFSENLLRNVFISRYLSKPLLTRYMKRIIKTKLRHSSVPTKELFMAGIRELNKKSIKFWFDKTHKLLKLSKDIHLFTTKYPILIINSKEARSSTKHEEKKRKDSTIDDKESDDLPLLTETKHHPNSKGDFDAGDLILTYQEELNALSKWSKLNKRL